MILDTEYKNTDSCYCGIWNGYKALIDIVLDRATPICRDNRRGKFGDVNIYIRVIVSSVLAFVYPTVSNASNELQFSSTPLVFAAGITPTKFGSSRLLAPPPLFHHQNNGISSGVRGKRGMG